MQHNLSKYFNLHFDLNLYNCLIYIKQGKKKFKVNFESETRPSKSFSITKTRA